VITTQTELAAALLIGGDVRCDPTVTIALTTTMAVGRPTRLLGGTFTISTGPAFEITSSNVEVDDLSITGAGNATFNIDQKLIHVLGTKTAPLNNIDVHDCRLTDSASDCLWLEWCVNSRAHHNMCERFANSGITVISGNGLAIDGNVVSDGAVAPGQVDVYGIALTDLTNVATDRTTACAVTGNRINLIDWEGIDTHGGTALTVTGNTVTATRRSIALVQGNPTRLTAPQHCVASGNAIDSTGARVTPDIGIFLAGGTGLPASATITGNTIAGYDAAGAQPIATTDWQRADTTVANNSRPHVPWTAVTLAGGWTANTSFPPQYTVDGNQVTFRGGVIPPVGGISGNPGIGSLANVAAWPATRIFYATTKGNDAAAGVGVLNIDPSGNLRVDHGSGTDQFTYWLTGTYTAI
jgi:hypothetical protein